MNEFTILVIEDSDDDLELVLHALRKCGITRPVQVARDGETALQILDVLNRSSAYRIPSLVLLDLKLPKDCGFRILEAIRAAKSMAFVPVVVLTSSAETSDMVSSYCLGANSYVRKPVDLPSFVAAMDQILRYWTEVNMVPASHDSL